jgi:polar amino acid transport system substrate-binding protein
MRALSSLGLAAALACGAAASQGAVAPAPGAALRLCADPANLPFSSHTADAAAPGLYVEIGQAVARSLGRPLQTVWSLSYFGKRNLRTTLLAGQCDLAVGLPAEADFMGPRLIFTRPILQLGYALVLPQGSTARSIDDLTGQRVAVQFGSPPQGLLAARSDITSVTAMDPEEAMRRLAGGEADAAFIWGASAGYINRVALNERYRVVPVAGPHMQFQAAIGLSSQQSGLRDAVDAVLDGLAPRIRELSDKYAVSQGAPILLAAAPPMQVALAEAPAPSTTPGTVAARRADLVKGKEIFNSTCAHCHGPSGVVEDRKINLRRLHLKYGEQLEESYFTTVTNGRPTKGMPAWKDVFSTQDFVDILGYLRTIQDR